MNQILIISKNKLKHIVFIKKKVILNYINTQFNEKLFNKLNNLFTQNDLIFKNNNLFTIYKLKEFYVLNDLFYLKVKIKKIIKY